MTICIASLDLCVRIPGPKAAVDRLAPNTSAEWAAFMPVDAEALIMESKRKGMALEVGIRSH